MADYAALEERKNELIRKALEGSVFKANRDAATIDEAALFLATNVRTVTDGVTTSASTALTSATAVFVVGDVGAVVTGTGIPAGTTIVSRTSGTAVVLSQAATATGTGVSITVAPLAGLKPLPDGYGDVGYLSEAGAQFARAVAENETRSWGATSPTRTDITSDTTTLQFTMQETKAATLGIYTGMDVEGIVPSAATGGSIMIAKPDLPSPRHYRFLTLAVDLVDGGELYLARYLPNAKVTSYEAQAFNNQGDPISYGVTATAYKDSVLGFTEAWLFGGPGWNALLEDMGFQAAA